MCVTDDNQISCDNEGMTRVLTVMAIGGVSGGGGALPHQQPLSGVAECVLF